MAGWCTHTGNAVALPMAGIDTDQLLPARFMSTPRGEGYGRFLMHDLRFDENGKARPNFPLNRHLDVSIIIAGRNFGGGSSREAAVYGLVDYGIRAVIAPSFGDIFASNAVNNGLLPAVVTEADSQALLGNLKDEASTLTVSLDTCQITLGDRFVPFTIDPVWRTKLIEGWDDIDLTASHAAAISAFSQRDHKERPWAYLGDQSNRSR
ncbi:MAG: 3-isopropylmalate dehydratase small subunit [Pseudomonadota bacterium]